MEKLSKKKKIWLLILIGILSILIIISSAIIYFNKYSLVLSIPEKTIHLEYGVDKMPEVTAICKGTLLCKIGIPVKTTTIGTVHLDKLGTYRVTYSAKYKKNSLKEVRTFIVQDTLAPEIQLISSPEHYTSPVGTYEEEGYQAIDNYDGDVTDRVIREEKEGIVTYTVTDSSGNTATKERKIIYKDVIPPTITLTGGETYHFNAGKTFTDPGFTAIDEVDGDITSKVTVEGSVDGMTYGTYTLTYHVEDSSGNVCDVVRTVKVGDFVAPTISLSGPARSYVLVGTVYSEPGYSASGELGT